ncbi:hypothetical protein SAMN02745206_02613 [Desulfacinum infernum DSM 9756]|uniref:DUF4139 domain-containing protein n=1 Tax=Desulfacinum infernum DSM 9756 TaxID=1121391 RepID=A0A1M5EAA4_9BACT|nr:hypothetical protein [Desulfacinum infernum]SHF76125.1 hypothetical protein SAMN02745206_02613 [Desulfacinum infernum DSM 9756]
MGGRIFRFLMTALLGLGMAAPQPASAVERALTITPSDGAWVRERMTVRVDPGRRTISLNGFLRTVRPETVELRLPSPESGVRDLGLVFRYRPINRANLLREYEGKDVQVVLFDPRGAQNARVIKSARVLDAGGGGEPVFLLDEGVWAGDVEAVLFPEVPDGLDGEPRVFWNVENLGSSPVELDVERTYEAGGFGWKALYVLTLEADSEKAHLAGDVLVQNASGSDLSGARVVLLAGDLQRVRSRRDDDVMEMAAAPMRLKAAPVEEAPVLEYHLYRLGDPVDLRDGERLRLPLVRGAAILVKKRLVSTGNAAFYGSWRGAEESRPQPVDVFLEIKNEASNGLGKPLPAGVVQGAMVTDAGARVPLGEDRIGHTPEGATMKLHFGRSFDVQVRRRLTDFQRISQHTTRCTWELEVQSGKARPETVELDEQVPGRWQVLRSSHRWEKVSAGLLRIPVEVPPQGVVRVTYEIEMDTRSG